MKNITKEDFLEALSKSMNKTQLMRNLGYKGGYRISQIKYNVVDNLTYNIEDGYSKYLNWIDKETTK